jgi:hypothetical protein
MRSLGYVAAEYASVLETSASTPYRKVTRDQIEHGGDQTGDFVLGEREAQGNSLHLSSEWLRQVPEFVDKDHRRVDGA